MRVPSIRQLEARLGLGEPLRRESIIGLTVLIVAILWESGEVLWLYSIGKTSEASVRAVAFVLFIGLLTAGTLKGLRLDLRVWLRVLGLSVPAALASYWLFFCAALFLIYATGHVAKLTFTSYLSGIAISAASAYLIVRAFNRLFPLVYTK